MLFYRLYLSEAKEFYDKKTGLKRISILLSGITATIFIFFLIAGLGKYDIKPNSNSNPFNLCHEKFTPNKEAMQNHDPILEMLLSDPEMKSLGNDTYQYCPKDKKLVLVTIFVHFFLVAMSILFSYLFIYLFMEKSLYISLLSIQFIFSSFFLFLSYGSILNIDFFKDFWLMFFLIYGISLSFINLINWIYVGFKKQNTDGEKA